MKNLINGIDLLQKIKTKDLSIILRAMIYHSHAGIFVADHNGQIVFVNQASAEMNGLPIERIIGKNVRDLIIRDLSTRSVTLEVLEEKKTISLINITKGNRKILTTGIPIFNIDGSIKFVFTNERDITFLNNLVRLIEKNDECGERSNFECINSDFVGKELDGLVFESKDMQIIIHSIIQIVKYNTDILITGESGVGKSVIAKLIHKLSNRNNGPFVDLNCGAISGNLLESELFGYVKGAFTGANREGKIGFIESAQNGTLFLDEIGEIPISLQAKMLKFLESKEVIRVGSIRPFKVDTRIITATNRDIEAMATAGEFRKDLFYRLNVLPINIPSLRNRQSDIEPLINLFVDRLNRQFKHNKKVAKEVVNALLEYDFPGNVRELNNLIKRMFVLTEGNTISLQQLPKSILNPFLSSQNYSKKLDRSLNSLVREFEAETIIKAIEIYGSQHKAAQKLSVDQSTLSRKLKQYKSHRIVQ